MPERRWVFDRGHPFIDPITERQARQLYEQTRRRPGVELEGTLEDGFEYTVARSSSHSFMRVKVYPAPAVPEQ